METSNKRKGLPRRKVLRGASTIAAAYGLARAATGFGTAQADAPRTDLKIAISDAQVKETLDPALSEITNSHVLVGAIYDHLLRFDQSWNLEPRLATKWDRSEDGKEWVFHLREGVRWHDGKPFTAEDVVYSISRLVNKDVGSDLYARLSPSIDANGIKAVDDHTVSVKLLRPDGLLPVTFGTRQSAMVPAGFKTRTTTVSEAIGCGPFKLQSYTPGQGWEAVRNDDYYRGKAILEKIRISVIPEQATKLQAVISGDFDACDAIPPSLAQTVLGNSEVKLAKLTADRMMVIVMDQKQKPFDDGRVRMALKRAVDRKKLLNLSYMGYGEVVQDVPVPPADPLSPSDVDHSLNIDEAKKLLSEAGYPNGIDLELNTSDSFGGMVDLAVAFGELVKPAGIRVKIKQHPPATYWDQVWLHAPMYVSYWTTRHAADRLEVTYGAKSHVNESHFADPNFQKIVDSALGASTPDEQAKLYKEALKMVAEESGLLVPFFIDKLWVARSNLDLHIALETQVDLATSKFS
jgi:peptide/nickel transport system substrate-binding protein